MTPKTVNIIGGGMAGLCAGSYLQMNGYEVTIYEMNSTPGGVCTSWQRGGYTVDLCIHWLVGSGPKSSFYERWNELVDLDEIKFVNHDEFLSVEDENGNYISVFTNIDRLEKEFLQKAPEDEKEIRTFIADLKKLAGFKIDTGTAPEVANIWHRLRSLWDLLPYLPAFTKYMRLSCFDYSRRFKNPLLKKAILNLPGADIGIIFGMITLTWFHNQTAGYPIGGSLNFAQKVFNNFLRLGGKIIFNAGVKSIIVEDNSAVGIELVNSERHFSDYTISAADGHSTIFEMLRGKYTDNNLVKFYKTAKTFSALVFVALGVKKAMNAVPHMLILPLKEPLVIDPESSLTDIIVHNHSYDPTLAPPGCTLLTIMLETRNYAHWDSIYLENRKLYEEEKERIARQIINILEQRFGGIAENVEMMDVSTPVSFRHFSGNWKGSFEGWLMTPANGLKHLSHTLPGLGHFYMCGQWVAIGGGLPGVLLSGRNTAQIICQEDSKKFEVQDTCFEGYQES